MRIMLDDMDKFDVCKNQRNAIISIEQDDTTLVIKVNKKHSGIIKIEEYEEIDL